MGIDHLIQLDCGVRRALGGADLERGSHAIMEAIKAADRAAMMRKMAAQQGIPAETMSIRSVKLLPTGPVEVDLTVAELDRQSQVLAPHVATCKGCPANLLGSAFGCYDSVPYPIPAAVEEWLMDRVQAPDTVGGTFLHRAIADFRYDGSAVRSYRERKLFEAPSPPTRSWKTGWFSSKTVNADQLWHAMLAVGPIAPSHGMMVLLWLGAIEIEGRIPTTPVTDSALVQTALRAAPGVRARTTKASLGPTERHGIRGLAAVQAFLNAMYVAWVNEAVLFVDA